MLSSNSQPTHIISTCVNVLTHSYKHSHKHSVDHTHKHSSKHFIYTNTYASKLSHWNPRSLLALYGYFSHSLLTISLTSPNHSLTHSLTLSLTCTHIHICTSSLTSPRTHLVTHSVIHTHTLIHFTHTHTQLQALTNSEPPSLALIDKHTHTNTHSCTHTNCIPIREQTHEFNFCTQSHGSFTRSCTQTHRHTLRWTLAHSQNIIHSLILTRTLIHSLTHSLIYSLIRSLTCTYFHLNHTLVPIHLQSLRYTLSFTNSYALSRTPCTQTQSQSHSSLCALVIFLSHWNSQR